jgi:hypothetical protein
LNEVEAPIQKCPLGKLAWFCNPRALAKNQRENVAQNHGASVTMHFQNILARVAPRAQHHHRQRLVDPPAIVIDN